MDIDLLYKKLLSNTPRVELLSFEKELFELIPELKKCKGFDQRNEWHVYDVYNHILHVIDYSPKNLTLRLAALFHDIGKPDSFKLDEDGIGHFYGHWIKSQEIFEKYADKYNIENKELISNLIYYHDINVSKLDNEGLDKMCEVFDMEGIRKLYSLKRADLLAQNGIYYYNLYGYNVEEKELLLKYKKR